MEKPGGAEPQTASSPQRAYTGRKREDPAPLPLLQERYDSALGQPAQKRIYPQLWQYAESDKEMGKA